MNILQVLYNKMHNYMHGYYEKYIETVTVTITGATYYPKHICIWQLCNRWNTYTGMWWNKCTDAWVNEQLGEKSVWLGNCECDLCMTCKLLPHKYSILTVVIFRPLEDFVNPFKTANCLDLHKIFSNTLSVCSLNRGTKMIIF